MNRRTTLAAALALTAGFALAGCGGDSAPKLSVSGAYMPQPVDQNMAGGFLVIKNSGDTADKLTSVTSDVAKSVTIHTTKDNKMEEVKSLDIPAGGELELARGGNHLMFMGLKKKPAEGQQVTVELHFDKSKPLKVEVPVKSGTYTPKDDGAKTGSGGGGSMDHGSMDHGSMQHDGSQHEGSTEGHSQHDAKK
ncbi:MULTISPECIES: copper chaperone PCu(A)C [Streptomyces]|uniref:Copper chaperone PCu(A)C n=2 Tax=Streptomyces rimosus subsp. rimosus TaxID=132474 RepID=L8F0N5_STRR1|nr:copper chaperone [Streptomyces rimosus]KOG71553.1 copper chaperone [Kitasatospora aureofaciens]KUJ32800.1 copper resistance protein CopZ [Streptomyces rimosus subsp. rimosus]MYT47141.1 copper chaperone PCu(A)C [Streptomyces sp. SID5471]QGY65501.1 copper chaperone PCu(A)C [Streptomyces rimosus R6-500]QST82428.1 copper chaperone PCu(A)C [Streptomyces rimosus subsp. rimosus ATCC 10970]RSO10383.1 copper chaperone PCu(A)C [Streptomyces sp. WAC 06783]RSO15815.1 copper chaperone PCu(A)C [Strepto